MNKKRETRVVAGPTTRALLPRLEGRLGVVPLDELLSFLVPEIHAPSVVEEDFFFSRRRRHTIWPRDWSSDVCSSDLRRLHRVDGEGPEVGRGRPRARGAAR